MSVSKIRTILIILAITLGGASLAGLYWIFGNLPSLDDLPEGLAIPSIRITDRHGRGLYDVLDNEGGRHTPVALDSIPAELQQATIATEDRSFYENPGVDIVGILRALWINLRGGETLAGGSTITQQVARNLLLTPEERFERTIRRKLRESWLAWRLSRRFSKDEILALYLNQMYYGGMAYGVEAAAQTYFGRPVSELNLAECALLAGLPQAPALYNPLIDPEAAQNRQHIVLELMLKQGQITREQHDLAVRQPLVYTSAPYPIEAPHFVMSVQAQLDALLPPATRSQHGGLIVRTTLDLDWQHHAERAVDRQLQALRESGASGQGNTSTRGGNMPGGHNVNNAALAAIDPQSGEILALVGSPDYFDAEHAGAINMAISPRQPGSALKPLVYAAAFDPTRPMPRTAATMILDVRTTFSTHEGEAYTPANFDNLEHGPVSAREALASSLNVPAVITLDYIGLGDLFDLAADLGISTFGDPDNYDLSLALGGGEVSLLELTAAYAAFANGGYRVTPFGILAITTTAGDVLFTAENPAPVQVLDEGVAWLISDILSDNDARIPGFGPNSSLRIDRPAAVKTGTTTNFHDNWTVGYTPELVVGVWVGNTNYEPMRAVTGLSGAAPIWHQFMRAALTGIPESQFEQPPDMVQIEVCALSGLLPTEVCPYTKWEWFIEGTQPATFDTVYQRVVVDSATGLLADESIPPGRRTTRLALDLPPQAHPWARSQGITLLSDLQVNNAFSYESFVTFPLQIVSPGQNAAYRISSNISPGAQQVHVEAVTSVGLSEVSLWLDGVLLVTRAQPPFDAWWPLEVGEHSVWAKGLTSGGELLQSPAVNFVVKADENQ
ncbi:MAG: PBP1A family penicillin-binding protein [Chloroflexota bacterium]